MSSTKPISELDKTDEQIAKRRKLIDLQGYWICDKCRAVYYAGINCEPCLEKEFKAEIKKIKPVSGSF